MAAMIAAVMAPKVISGIEPLYVFSRFATTRLAKKIAVTPIQPSAKRITPP